jgi:hypothetical protein
MHGLMVAVDALSRSGGTAAVLGGLALLVVAGCGQVAPPAEQRETSPSPAASTPESTKPSARTAPGSTPTSEPPPSTPTAAPRCPSQVPRRLSLTGEEGRAFAFAPLSDPTEITVEGEVDGAEAWSTSKVLVVAAFLDTTADGDPAAVSTTNRRLITAALTRSDGDAVRALREQIPGRPGVAMTSLLRSIGDTSTTAPDSLEGTMTWTSRQQVRFMAALQRGKVSSAEISDYLLESMRPIEQHRWGLGTVGGTTFKGGWLRQGRVTRQMGLLDGYAVAIITDRGPVVRQSDGDSAHVAAMDDLAERLADRLAYERRCG